MQQRRDGSISTRALDVCSGIQQMPAEFDVTTAGSATQGFVQIVNRGILAHEVGQRCALAEHCRALDSIRHALAEYVVDLRIPRWIGQRIPRTARVEERRHYALVLSLGMPLDLSAAMDSKT